MKVVQINCVYNFGSTGIITKDLHEGLLSRGYESVVLYGRLQHTNKPFVYKTCSEFEAKANNVMSRFTGKPYAVSLVGTHRLLRKLEKEKPDVVHLQCINGFFVNIYVLLNYLKQQHIPTVLTLHAEFMYTGNCGHAFDCDEWKAGCNRCVNIREAIGSRWYDTANWNWNKMKEAFEGFDNLTICSVSDWVRKRAEESPIFAKYPIITVWNGVDINVFQYDEMGAAKIREKYNIGTRKLVLHVTANFQNEIKGGRYITMLAKDLPIDKYVVMVVDGTSNEKPANFAGVYLKKASNQQELAALYSAADMTVLTSKRETFSMICAESLCCGAPIIGFKAGAPETISLAQYSKFLEYGDMIELKKRINSAEQPDHKMISIISKETYCKEKMLDEYVGLYRRAEVNARNL